MYFLAINPISSKSCQRVIAIISLLIIQFIQPRTCSIRKAVKPENKNIKPGSIENATISQSSPLIWSSSSKLIPVNNLHDPESAVTVLKVNKSYNSNKNGFLEAAIKYLKTSKIIQNYATNIKRDLSDFVESERLSLFSTGRSSNYGYAGAAAPKPGWMESAMVPMAFITFAMFLMDIMQRMFPYYGGFGNQYYDNYNNVQMPVTEPESTSIKFSSLFGRSNGFDYNTRKNKTSTAYTTRVPVYNSVQVNNANAHNHQHRLPTRNKSGKNGRRIPPKKGAAKNGKLKLMTNGISNNNYNNQNTYSTYNALMSLSSANRDDSQIMASADTPYFYEL